MYRILDFIDIIVPSNIVENATNRQFHFSFTSQNVTLHYQNSNSKHVICNIWMFSENR